MCFFPARLSKYFPFGSLLVLNFALVLASCAGDAASRKTAITVALIWCLLASTLLAFLKRLPPNSPRYGGARVLRTATADFVLMCDAHVVGHAAISAVAFTSLGFFTESVRQPLFPGVEPLWFLAAQYVLLLFACLLTLVVVDATPGLTTIPFPFLLPSSPPRNHLCVHACPAHRACLPSRSTDLRSSASGGSALFAASAAAAAGGKSGEQAGGATPRRTPSRTPYLLQLAREAGAPVAPMTPDALLPAEAAQTGGGEGVKEAAEEVERNERAGVEAEQRSVGAGEPGGRQERGAEDTVAPGGHKTAEGAADVDKGRMAEPEGSAEKKEAERSEQDLQRGSEEGEMERAGRAEAEARRDAGTGGAAEPGKRNSKAGGERGARGGVTGGRTSGGRREKRAADKGEGEGGDPRTAEGMEGCIGAIKTAQHGGGTEEGRAREEAADECSSPGEGEREQEAIAEALVGKEAEEGAVRGEEVTEEGEGGEGATEEAARGEEADEEAEEEAEEEGVREEMTRRLVVARFHSLVSHVKTAAAALLHAHAAEGRATPASMGTPPGSGAEEGGGGERGRAEAEYEEAVQQVGRMVGAMAGMGLQDHPLPAAPGRLHPPSATPRPAPPPLPPPASPTRLLFLRLWLPPLACVPPTPDLRAALGDVVEAMGEGERAEVEKMVAQVMRAWGEGGEQEDR
ncbi:unnamed protein product [Closterium sp. Yama58-4]|nr:unnamed protein product [Closterium sp. Yama58-4]